VNQPSYHGEHAQHYRPLSNFKITTLPAIPVGQLKAKLKGSKQMGKRS
jgi:hypothetical protein